MYINMERIEKKINFDAVKLIFLESKFVGFLVFFFLVCFGIFVCFFLSVLLKWTDRKDITISSRVASSSSNPWFQLISTSFGFVPQWKFFNFSVYSRK